MESGVFGAGIAAGAHLMICPFSPSEIAHLVDKNGAPFIQEGVVISIGELHSIHIFAAGAATIYLSLSALAAACKDPSGSSHISRQKTKSGGFR